MLPLILGAAGAVLVVSKVLSDRDGTRRNFPFVPYEWWTPRDHLFTVKSRALAVVSGERLGQLYEAYARAHPDHTFGHLLLSLVAGSRGDWQAARSHAERLIESGPESVGQWRLVDCCLKLGDRAGAIAASRRFIELESDSLLAPHLKTTITRLEAELATAAAARPTRRARSTKKVAAAAPTKATPRRPKKAAAATRPATKRRSSKRAKTQATVPTAP